MSGFWDKYSGLAPLSTPHSSGFTRAIAKDKGHLRQQPQTKLVVWSSVLKIWLGICLRIGSRASSRILGNLAVDLLSRPNLGETRRLTANPTPLASLGPWPCPTPGPFCVTLISDPGSYDLIEARLLPCKCHLAPLLRCPRVVPCPPPCCLWPRLVPYSLAVELSGALLAVSRSLQSTPYNRQSRRLLHLRSYSPTLRPSLHNLPCMLYLCSLQHYTVRFYGGYKILWFVHDAEVPHQQTSHAVHISQHSIFSLRSFSTRLPHLGRCLVFLCAVVNFDQLLISLTAISWLSRSSPKSEVQAPRRALLA